MPTQYYCKDCGAEIKEDSVFCRACGAKLSDVGKAKAEKSKP